MKDTGALLIAIYGIIAFSFLIFDINDLPFKYRKLYFTSYTFIEYIFFAFLIILNIKNNLVQKLIIFLSILFFAFQCFYFFNTKTARLDSIPVGVETILLFLYIFFFFYENFKNPNTIYIYHNYGFWIAIGILVYLGGAFFVYILANHLAEVDLEKYWDITYISEIIKNTFFVISIYIYNSKKDTSINSKPNLPYLDIN